MKLGNFTLVLSGRNDWVETTQAARDTRRDARQQQ